MSDWRMFISLVLIGVLGVTLYGFMRTLYEVFRTIDSGEDGE